MLTSLDHLVLLCPSISEGRAAYETLLGRQADWNSIDSEGIGSCFFQMRNVALELIAPVGNSPLAARLKQRLIDQGAGLQSIVFQSDDLDADRRVFERRALKPDEMLSGQSVDLGTGLTRSWRRMRFDTSATNGLRMFTLQRQANDPLVAKPAAENALFGLDHLVASTTNADSALALYGARLGLRLTLDLSDAQRGLRLMSFKLASSRIEISHRTSTAPTAASDKLWGLTWLTNDIDGAHQRMQNAGLNVSEVRKGLSPKTRVFTVREGTLSVPTLVLAHSPSD